MDRREALKLSAGMMGYGLAGMIFPAMLNGCKVDIGPDWIPTFFTKPDGVLIGEIVDHILPRTETPGARDVMVDRFIDKLLFECYPSTSQQEFLEGMEAFKSYCEDNFGKGFEDCSKEERDAVLAHMEAESYSPSKSMWGNTIRDEADPSFYRQLKGLALLGYFTSEPVGKNVLNYDPIPGHFIGCKPLSEIGNAWTLG